MAGNGRAGTSSALMGSGDAFMPRFSEKRLARLVQKEKNTLAKFRLLACLGRKKDRSIRRTAGDLGFAYSTVRDWLVRILERSLKGRYNKKPPGRKRKLSPSTIRVVRRRLKKSPQRCGFESGNRRRMQDKVSRRGRRHPACNGRLRRTRFVCNRHSIERVMPDR